MPTQNRVGRNNGRKLRQGFAAEDLPFHRKSTALVIIEQNAFLAHFLLQHLILGP